ncbi:hypothetical protein [Cyanobium sp. HWJ4-Hawea]|uniref:hypothetical protein n=1 Tax=Cyanobium sp. HWJ4-Hawea TaxID=2823713 RepID=UPI0020CE0757|nr:hypothetical protein [Cyanobium sp. HWJ4-Hawea]
MNGSHPDLVNDWLRTSQILQEFTQHHRCSYYQLGVNHGCRYAVPTCIQAVAEWHQYLLLIEDDIQVSGLSLPLLGTILDKLESSCEKTVSFATGFISDACYHDAKKSFIFTSSYRPGMGGWLMKSSFMIGYLVNREAWLSKLISSLSLDVFAERSLCSLFLDVLFSAPRIFSCYDCSAWNYQLAYISFIARSKHLHLDSSIVQNVGFDDKIGYTRLSPVDTGSLRSFLILPIYLGFAYAAKFLYKNSLVSKVGFSLRKRLDNLVNKIVNFLPPVFVPALGDARWNLGSYSAKEFTPSSDFVGEKTRSSYEFYNFYGLGDIIQDYVFLSCIALTNPSIVITYFVREEVYLVANLWLNSVSNLHVRPCAPGILTSAINIWKNSKLTWTKSKLVYAGSHDSRRSYSDFYQAFYRFLISNYSLPLRQLRSKSRLDLVYSSVFRHRYNAIVSICPRKPDIFVLNQRPLSQQLGIDCVVNLEILVESLKRLNPYLDIECSTSYASDRSGINKFSFTSAVCMAANSLALISVASGPFFLAINTRIKSIFALCSVEDVDVSPNIACYSNYFNFLPFFFAYCRDNSILHEDID